MRNDLQLLGSINPVSDAAATEWAGSTASAHVWSIVADELAGDPTSFQGLDLTSGRVADQGEVRDGIGSKERTRPVLVGSDPVGPIRLSEPRRPPKWLQRVAVAVSAAVAVLAVGGVTWLLRSDAGVPPADDSTVTTTADVTTSSPVATTVFTTTPLSSLVWSRVPHDESVFGGEGHETIFGVTVGGPGLVAVGADLRGGGSVAAVWTSPDGLTWSRVPHDESVFGGETGLGMWSVTTGGPGMVAVGADQRDGETVAAVWTSPDGLTWSRVPHDESVFGGDTGLGMLSVTSGGPGLVAVGAGAQQGDMSAAVWTSPDGLTWSRVPHNEAVFGGEATQRMWSVTAGELGLVAVGFDGPQGESTAAVWTSPDGLTWSRVPHDESIFGGETALEMLSVTVGGPGLVAVGWDAGHAAVWTSPDGLTWSRVPHDEAVFGRGGLEMKSVTAAGQGLVAVGSDASYAAVWTSPDGFTWSRIPDDESVFAHETTQEMWSVTAGGPGLVAVGFDVSSGAAVWIASDAG